MLCEGERRLQLAHSEDTRMSARRWAFPYGRLASGVVSPPRPSRGKTHGTAAAVRHARQFSVWVGISVGEGVGISTDLFSLQAYQRRGVQTLAQITLPSITLSNDTLPSILATVSQDGALDHDPSSRAGSRDSAVLRAGAPWWGA